ncbi:MAG: DAK2 domain-containing protein [Coriobacteriales bacterium]|jgi:DAK2 domain fusion protein YloV
MNIRDMRSYIVCAAQALSARKEEINRLNVFPVPDGDTGTNMSLTMESVVKEVNALPADCDSAALRKAVTHGSLMGARGNSGVITSQILRGLCEGLADASEFDAATISKGLDRAVEVAFQAVRKPVKGTILTVLEDSAAAAHKAVDDGLDAMDCLRAISDEALASVKRTPEFLPVLKENGVVDSGGFGLTILIQSFVAAVTGDEGELASSADFTKATAEVAIEQVHDWAGSKYMYCTEFLFHSADVDTKAALEFLASIGDCELLVGNHPDFKVHVHTDTPGEVLNYMTERGQVSEVFIHNMVLESEERAEGIAAGEEAAAAEHKPLAFIAVAAGSGMASILKSLGVDYVVSGGQTMNPSTADLLSAIEKVNADAAILLPDNKNIIMAANAAAENADIPVKVVPTKNVPSAFTAMFAVDLDAGLEENAEAMTAALEDVVCGEVTTAIKDSKTSSGDPIAPGDVIGIAEGSLDVVGHDVDEVTLALIDEFSGQDEYDTLTLLAGEDFDDEALDGLTKKIEERFPDIEIDAQRGEQPLYPIVFSLE